MVIDLINPQSQQTRARCILRDVYRVGSLAGGSKRTANHCSVTPGLISRSQAVLIKRCAV